MKNSIVRYGVFSPYFIHILILLILSQSLGCRKFVEVPIPDSSLSTENVFSSDATAQAAVAGIYSSLWDKGFFVSLYAGLSADEFQDYSFSSSREEFNQNALLPSNPEVNNLWGYFYSSIYQCNSVIEGLTNNTEISGVLQRQLNAEALTLRAFCYYYLVNFWGAIPLILSTDYLSNARANRCTVDSVYNQILKDLQAAEPGLPADYSSMERARLSSWANLALQSRVYAVLQNWPKVESLSTEIINQPLFELPTYLDSVFLRNSSEAIWQLEPQDPDFSTYEGSQFILNSTPTVVALKDWLLQSFEPGDLRKDFWVGVVEVSGVDYAYPFKYKDIQATDPLREYAMVFRLGEQYLLRAEARAEQNNLVGGLEDLNSLRRRTSLPDQSAVDKETLLGEITHEHQVEFFSEWGDRWIYLKRTGQANVILSAEKPGWNTAGMLYPIPLTEINNDPNLIQNGGY